MESIKALKNKITPKQKAKTKVCIHCGGEVSRCGNTSSCELLYDKPVYFCGSCGEYGSHVQAIDKDRWLKAQKILNS